MINIFTKIGLSEDTRIQTVTFNSEKEVYSLHYKDDYYYITDHTDETIYASFTKKMYELWFNH